MLAAFATLSLVLLASPASPAHAADGVDLQAAINGDVFFNPGSILNFFPQVFNAGTVTATGVVETIDLISTDGPLDFTFIGRYNGCSAVSPTEARCPVPDVAPLKRATAELTPSVMEAHHSPGSVASIATNVLVKVTVTSDQADPNPADNDVTASNPVWRDVRSGPTDWSVSIDTLGPIVNGEARFQAAFRNNGPSQVDGGEMIMTLVAPPGTEWKLDGPLPDCPVVSPSTDYRCPSPNLVQVGQTVVFGGTLTLTGGPLGIGQVEADGMGGDPNLTNNSAKIDLRGANAVPTPTGSPTGTVRNPIVPTAIASVADAGAKLARRDTGR